MNSSKARCYDGHYFASVMLLFKYRKICCCCFSFYLLLFFFFFKYMFCFFVLFFSYKQNLIYNLHKSFYLSLFRLSFCWFSHKILNIYLLFSSNKKTIGWIVWKSKEQSELRYEEMRVYVCILGTQWKEFLWRNFQ